MSGGDYLEIWGDKKPLQQFQTDDKDQKILAFLNFLNSKEFIPIFMVYHDDRMIMAEILC